MINLNRKVDEMTYDGLITGLLPAVRVRGGTIAKLTAEATYERGTVLAKSSADGKLYILGTAAAEGKTMTADCILCDTVMVGTEEDVQAAVYTAGCFDPEKVHVAEGYTMTDADKTQLRQFDIDFKAALPY